MFDIEKTGLIFLFLGLAALGVALVSMLVFLVKNGDWIWAIGIFGLISIFISAFLAGLT